MVGPILAAALVVAPPAQGDNSQSPAAAVAAAGPTDPAVIKPFKIRVSDDVLRDLQQRLLRARFPDELPDANWDYGTKTAYLRELVEYWRNRYDWRSQERMLNRWDQFKTTIDGVDVHFIHQRSKYPNARPLLLLNGWPSSIIEYHKVIASLTDSGRGEDSYHVVIPSMPGYGFSGKQPGRGYDPERVARMWVQLMARLGYTRYFVHGTDWGQIIAPRVALNDPEHVFGLHMPCGGAPPPDPSRKAAVQAVNPNVDGAHNQGYIEIQSTKPQTLGHALNDSPVGLASWILDKWFAWSDHDGDLEPIYSRDDLITNIMLYWVTDSSTSSMRLYYESRHVNGEIQPTLVQRPQGRPGVPTGCAVFARQYDRRDAPPLDAEQARKAVEGRYNLVHFAVLPRGGHFPALEQPSLWLEDLRAFLRVVK